MSTIQVAGETAVKLPPTPAQKNQALKRINPTNSDGERMVQALASMDSFKATKIFLFLELAKQAIDELYDRYK